MHHTESTSVKSNMSTIQRGVSCLFIYLFVSGIHTMYNVYNYTYITGRTKHILPWIYMYRAQDMYKRSYSEDLVHLHKLITELHYDHRVTL